MAVLSEAPRTMSAEAQRLEAPRGISLLVVAAGLLVAFALALLAQRILITSSYPVDALLLFVFSGFVFLGTLERARRRGREAVTGAEPSGALAEQATIQ